MEGNPTADGGAQRGIVFRATEQVRPTGAPPTDALLVAGWLGWACAAACLSGPAPAPVSSPASPAQRAQK